MRRPYAGVLLFLVVASLGAATFTVTSTSDSGAGSLRQAILDANANPGSDTIVFAIPGSGVQTITAASDTRRSPTPSSSTATRSLARVRIRTHWLTTRCS